MLLLLLLFHFIHIAHVGISIKRICKCQARNASINCNCLSIPTVRLVALTKLAWSSMHPCSMNAMIKTQWHSVRNTVIEVDSFHHYAYLFQMHASYYSDFQVVNCMWSTLKSNAVQHKKHEWSSHRMSRPRLLFVVHCVIENKENLIRIDIFNWEIFIIDVNSNKSCSLFVCVVRLRLVCSISSTMQV